MKINILISLLALILLSTRALFEINFLGYAAPIPYAQIRSISFNDFKGYKRPAQTLNGVSEFAFIKTSREIKLLPGNKLFATTYFYPSRSYVFNQHIRNSDLLEHELYHFHISEYFTRLIRKAIFEYDAEVTSSIVIQFNTKYTRMEREMQLQYDSESYHSYLLGEQKRWEKFIDSSLLSLDQFQYPLIDLKDRR